MAMNPRLLRPLASGFSPSRLSGLFGWYDASVASSVTVQTGVQSWSDLAGSMGAAIQNTTNNQPAYGAVTVNGKPTLTFDGTNDFLRTSAFSLPQPYMIFAVFQFEVSYSSAVRVLEMGTGAVRAGELIRIDADVLQLSDGSNAPSFSNYTAGDLETFGIHEAELNGASSLLRYDGVDAGDPANNLNTATQLTLGANRINTGASNISVAELIVYSRILSASQAASVRQYLRGKWAL